MRNIFFLSLFFTFFIFENAFAQPNIYFINRQKHKIITVSPGQQLSLKYKGYMNQSEFAKHTVTDVSDSFITLGIDPQMFGNGLGKMLSNSPSYVYRKVRITDILSFRKISNSRLLVKNTLLIGNIVGSYFVLSNLYKQNNFTVGQSFLISLGTGIFSAILINSILPENPKYKMEDGWEIRTGYVKPAL